MEQKLAWLAVPLAVDEDCVFCGIPIVRVIGVNW